ncbi:MAG: hypothetical protein L6R40_008103 [Gallowayella cf. fulva]|nr:MAG: hypothetical protein L6R40_008103 [Xanthomendoza cf. fulva]
MALAHQPFKLRIGSLLNTVMSSLSQAAVFLGTNNGCRYPFMESFKNDHFFSNLSGPRHTLKKSTSFFYLLPYFLFFLARQHHTLSDDHGPLRRPAAATATAAAATAAIAAAIGTAGHAAAAAIIPNARMLPAPGHNRVKLPYVSGLALEFLSSLLTDGTDNQPGPLVPYSGQQPQQQQ